MSTVPGREYEFTQEQNSVIGGLAARMRGVGLLLILVALFNFLFTVVVVLVIYRAKLPQHYVDSVLKAASDATKINVRAELANLPPDTHLWGIAIFSAANFLIYLLVGVWTRQAAGGFQQIVTTEGRDISHLMRALSALNRMYSLVYTLMAIGLVLLLVAVGFFIYSTITR